MSVTDSAIQWTSGAAALLHDQELWLCCTIRSCGSVALSGAVALLHYRELRLCCTIRSCGSVALSGAAALLHDQELWLCCTIRSCGSAARSGAAALLHYARTMSHKLLFSVCIHQGEFRRIYLSFLGLGNTLPCYFRQYQCIMPTCFLSITQDSTNIDWVITTLQARLKAVKTVCPKSLQSCPTLYSPMDRSPALSSVLGALKSRIMERVVISASRDLPDPGIEPASHVSCIGSRFFTNSATWEAQNHSTR